MIIKIGKYIVGLLAVLLATGCATTNFEWVKINPEKIQLAKKTAPYSDKVRQVSMVLQLKEKDMVLYYPESNGFFELAESKSEIATHRSTLQNNIKKSNRFAKAFKAQPLKVTVQVPEKVLNKPQPNPVVKVDSEADKLNSALKIPLNSKAIKAGKNAASFGPSASEMREMAFNDIKKKNPELEQKAAQNQQRGKNLIWAGLMLIVLGGVMGFVFGRSAFLISLAGAVFAGIGYFFKI
ncbi:hypothetical protein [Pedobacter arcticus]|uniref:hypothetical protein n=1 Tax=Pedobacter arcticus TaxID=752140 RepID=UPI0003095AF5|nr:hypothetical protein [Pedobacter arcticus]